jgi:hypothetical protein
MSSLYFLPHFLQIIVSPFWGQYSKMEKIPAQGPGFKKVGLPADSLLLYRRGLACHGSELPVLPKQVLHERSESTHNAVTFARVLEGHDSLTQNVARTQVELAAGLVAEVDECLAGEFAALDGRAVEPVLVEPLVVILCL